MTGELEHSELHQNAMIVSSALSIKPFLNKHAILPDSYLLDNKVANMSRDRLMCNRYAITPIFYKQGIQKIYDLDSICTYELIGAEVP